MINFRTESYQGLIQSILTEARTLGYVRGVRSVAVTANFSILGVSSSIDVLVSSTQPASTRNLLWLCDDPTSAKYLHLLQCSDATNNVWVPAFAKVLTGLNDPAAGFALLGKNTAGFVKGIAGMGSCSPYLLFKSNVPVTRNSTNTTGTAGVDDDEEVTMWTGTIPANLLSGSTSIYVHAFWRSTSSASVKTLGLRIGGTSFGAITCTTNGANQLSCLVHAANSATAQKLVNNASGGFNGTSAAVYDAAVNMAIDQAVTLTSKWNGAVASEVITLEAMMIEVFPDPT